MSRKVWMRALVALIVSWALVITGASSAGADSHTPGGDYTAPAPLKSDPDGTDQDRFYIPEAYFDGMFNHPVYGFGQYYFNGESLTEGWYSTGGASSVTITTDWDSGTWVFDYTSGSAGAEAANKYAVVVDDACKWSSYGYGAYRKATAYFTNVADDTGRYVHSIYPRAVNSNGDLVYDTKSVQDIRDGETVAIPIKIFDESLPGLTPGKYRVDFWRADKGFAGDLEGRIVKTMSVVVPACGKQSGTQANARGNLKRVNHHRVKAVANARRFNAAPKAVYRLVERASGKMIHQRSFKVNAGTQRVLYAKTHRPRATVVLKVKRPNGRWVQLDQVRMSRR